VRTSLEGGVRAFSPKKGGTEKTEEEKRKYKSSKKQFFLLFLYHIICVQPRGYMYTTRFPPIGIVVFGICPQQRL